MDLRDAINALRFERTMVYLFLMTVLAQNCVCLSLPRFAPALQHLLAVPVPIFLPESIRAEGAHRQQNMRMWVMAFGVMDSNISNHAARNKLTLCVLAD